MNGLIGNDVGEYDDVLLSHELETDEVERIRREDIRDIQYE